MAILLSLQENLELNGGRNLIQKKTTKLRIIEWFSKKSTGTIYCQVSVAQNSCQHQVISGQIENRIQETSLRDALNMKPCINLQNNFLK